MHGSMIDASKFYANYYGHPLEDLAILHTHLREGNRRVVWLCGDSSLDNKHWLYPGGGGTKQGNQLKDDAFCGDAVAGYEGILQPPRCVKDVAYWLNREVYGPRKD